VGIFKDAENAGADVGFEVFIISNLLVFQI